MVENRLREILTREKVTAYRLSKDLGIDEGQLSKFLNSKINISLRKLEQIADYLGYGIEFVKVNTPKKGGK